VAFVFGALLLVNKLATGRTKAVDKSVSKKIEKEKEEYEAINQKKINPSGTHLIYKLLTKYRLVNSIKRIQTSYFIDLKEKLPLESENEYPNVYVSVAEEFALTKTDNDYIYDFVEDGNFAVISCESISLDFANYLLPNSDIPFYVEADTSVKLTFAHPNFKQEKEMELKNSELNYHSLPQYKNWYIFNFDAINDKAIDILYFNEHNVACLKIQYGKGSFIFHTLPDAFSNSFLATKAGKSHAEIIFSHIPKGNYFWHENFGKYSTYRGDSNPDKLQKPKEYSKSSPLQYVLSVPSLTMALVLSIVGLLLYLIVKSKRKQRIIPPLESDKNSSLEFIEVIAKLYQQQNQHDKIIKHIESNLTNFIKHHYYIQFSIVNEEVIEKIHLKSGVEKELIAKIYKGFKVLSTQKVKDSQLIELHQDIELFHQNRN